jgi:hypothetical protein
LEYPPHECIWSIFASSIRASTIRLPSGTSNVPTPSTVNFGMQKLLISDPADSHYSLPQVKIISQNAIEPQRAQRGEESTEKILF